jgi:predicted regulator of Ras-like GTPase activity (Roadblock/LC7/MglB family)
MSAALTGLNQIPGVVGSVLFNHDDEVVVSMMPPPYDRELLGGVMAELRNTLNVLAYLDENATWNAIVARFDTGYLVLRQVQRMTILVLAQSTLNPAMLSVGFNVAALKLEKEGLPPAPLPPPPLPPPPRASTVPAAIAPPAPIAAAAVMAQQAPPPNLTPPRGMPPASGTPAPTGLSSRDLSISQSGGIPGIAPVSQSSPRLASASVSGFRSDSQDTNPALPDAVGKNIMDGLLKALARHIGPFAKLIMKEELTKLGATATTLGFGQYEDFVSLLSRRVQDPAKRREFITEAEALPHKR